jgi:hypothetical protein
LKGWDVCLLPFARNESTKFISPTKTLEYMAAGKPIVSTAVADVVRNFAPVVTIANSHDEFIAAVTKEAGSPDAQRIADGIEMATSSSWESIVSRMQSLINAAVDETPILDTARMTTSPVAPAQAELPGA